MSKHHYAGGEPGFDTLAARLRRQGFPVSPWDLNEHRSDCRCTIDHLNAGTRDERCRSFDWPGWARRKRGYRHEPRNHLVIAPDGPHGVTRVATKKAARELGKLAREAPGTYNVEVDFGHANPHYVRAMRDALGKGRVVVPGQRRWDRYNRREVFPTRPCVSVAERVALTAWLDNLERS
jgi:hypothetical protein